jgi:nitrite reductase/ring-hydroxylating ferredoxin subunit
MHSGIPSIFQPVRRQLARLLSITAFGAFILSLSFACKKDDGSQIPNVPVNLTLYLSLPEYSALNSVGNSILISGGYKGIIVYRKSIDGFAAYDRACSYDPTTTGAILEIDSSLVQAVDRKCGSRFNLFDGSISNGPATRPLRSYAAEYDAAAQTLYIHN